MLSTAVVLFFIIDPFGLVPVFLGVLGKLPRERRGRVLIRELVFALVALLIGLFAGRYVLAALHISQPALTIAGAIVLFLIAIPMIFPSVKLSMETEGEVDPFIVPLAIPMFAGPSAFAMVILLGSGGRPGTWIEWTGAVVLAWAAAGAVLWLGSRLSARLGKRGLVALERLMGMLLVAIAVEMALSGIAAYLETFAPPGV